MRTHSHRARPAHPVSGLGLAISSFSTAVPRDQSASPPPGCLCQTVEVAVVRGVVTRWLDDHQPGFVEFMLTDIDGVRHVVHEKVPILTLEVLSSSSTYPRELWVGADVLHCGRGSATVRLGAEVTSVDGRTEFTVPLSSVRDE